MWRPLITDPREVARIRTTVRDIVEALATAPIGNRRVGTHCDHAVMNAYLGAEDAVLDHAASAIAAQAEQPHGLALHGGLAGVGWTIAHLASDANAEAICTEIDAALLQQLAAWSDGYDLISGLVGFGVYALERGVAGRALAARVLALLDETAEPRRAGRAWKTQPRELIPEQLAIAPDGYWNLGLAHGVPGVVAFCARCVACGIEESRARALASQAIQYLLDAEPENDRGRFPSWHLPDGTSAGDRSRLAWCYSDLGVAAALLAAAQIDPQWRPDAITLARACAARASTHSARDTGLCHGAAGIAHAFNRMYQATGDSVLGDAARRWLSRTLDMRRDHPYAGFPSFDVESGAWCPDPTLLGGATGVALALHATVSDVEPQWDRTMLLDLAPRD